MGRATISRFASRVAVALAMAAAGCGSDASDDGSGGGGGGGSAADALPGDAAPVTDSGAAPDMGVADGPCGHTSASLRDCVQTDRYTAELTGLAQVREPGSPGWQAARDRCASELARLGFRVERWDYGTGTDVVGVLPGAEKPDEQVLLSAHYDSVPRCEGADDNASGVAGVLEAARVLSTQRYARTLVVACWDEEELGAIGSTRYAERAKARGDRIVANFVFEMIGYRSDEPDAQRLPPGLDLLFPMQAQWIGDRMSRGDFIALVGDDLNEGAAADMEAHAAAVGLPLVRFALFDALRKSDQAAALRRSDHAPFWDRDYPGVMITDTAEFRYPDYHCAWAPDALANVDMAFAANVVRATVGAAADQLEVRPGAEPPATDAGVPSDAGVAPPPAPPCDLAAQDCGEGKKCTVADDGTGKVRVACVDVTGQGALHDPCARPDGRVGHDDCAPGFLCALWGLPKGDPQPRQCLPVCTSSDQCGPDAFCAVVSGVAAGACVARCDPFADACAEGTQCSRFDAVEAHTNAFGCLYGGMIAAGADCTGFADCVPGATCSSVAHSVALRCHAFCDADHPCPDGQQCVRDTYDGRQTVGYCGTPGE
jgi:hypothetical protein